MWSLSRQSGLILPVAPKVTLRKDHRDIIIIFLVRSKKPTRDQPSPSSRRVLVEVTCSRLEGRVFLIGETEARAGDAVLHKLLCHLP